jgi:hypothetical protein
MFPIASSVVAKLIRERSASNGKEMICDDGTRLAPRSLHHPRPDTWIQTHWN